MGSRKRILSHQLTRKYTAEYHQRRGGEVLTGQQWHDSMVQCREWKDAVQEQTPVEHWREGFYFSKGSGLTWQTEVDLKENIHHIYIPNVSQKHFVTLQTLLYNRKTSETFLRKCHILSLFVCWITAQCVVRFLHWQCGHSLPATKYLQCNFQVQCDLDQRKGVWQNSSNRKFCSMPVLQFFLSLYGHKLPVLCMDISSDSTLIVTGSADRNVKLWGLDFGDCHKSIFAHDDRYVSIFQCVPSEWSTWPYGCHIALTENERDLCDESKRDSKELWKKSNSFNFIMATLCLPSLLTLWSCTVFSIMCTQFVHKTHMFFTGGKDGRVKQWDGDTFDHIQTLEVGTEKSKEPFTWFRMLWQNEEKTSSTAHVLNCCKKVRKQDLVLVWSLHTITAVGNFCLQTDFRLGNFFESEEKNKVEKSISVSQTMQTRCIPVCYDGPSLPPYMQSGSR